MYPTEQAAEERAKKVAASYGLPVIVYRATHQLDIEQYGVAYCIGDEDLLKAIKQAKADYIQDFNKIAKNRGFQQWNDRFYDPNQGIAKLYF